MTRGGDMQHEEQSYKVNFEVLRKKRLSEFLFEKLSFREFLMKERHRMAPSFFPG